MPASWPDLHTGPCLRCYIYENLLKSVALALAAVFIFTFLVGLGSEIAHAPAGFRGALLIASVASAIAIPVILLWCLPVHILLRKYNKAELNWYLVCGAFPGFVIIFVLQPFGEDEFSTLLGQSVMLSVVGILAGSVF